MSIFTAAIVSNTFNSDMSIPILLFLLLCIIAFSISVHALSRAIHKMSISLDSFHDEISEIIKQDDKIDTQIRNRLQALERKLAGIKCRELVNLKERADIRAKANDQEPEPFPTFSDEEETHHSSERIGCRSPRHQKSFLNLNQMYNPFVKVAERIEPKAEKQNNQQSTFPTFENMLPEMERTSHPLPPAMSNDGRDSEKRLERRGAIYHGQGAERNVSIVTPKDVLSFEALGIFGDVGTRSDERERLKEDSIAGRSSDEMGWCDSRERMLRLVEMDVQQEVEEEVERPRRKRDLKRNKSCAVS